MHFSHSLLRRKEGSRKSGTSRGLFVRFLRVSLPFPGMKSSPLSVKPALQSATKTFPSLPLLPPFLFSQPTFFVSPRVTSFRKRIPTRSRRISIKCMSVNRHPIQLFTVKQFNSRLSSGSILTIFHKVSIKCIGKVPRLYAETRIY